MKVTARAFMALAFLILFSSGVRANQVWYTSNVGTEDMLELFSNPSSWEKARSRVNVIKFYPGQLEADSAAQCPLCKHNIFPNLRARGFIEKMKEWNIAMGAELGAVKDWDCDGTQNVEVALNLFRKMKRFDAHIDYVTLDEPFVSGHEWCKQDDMITARHTAQYIKRVRDGHDQLYPGREFKLGLIEAYPHFNADQIINYFKMIQQFNVKLDFLHLDIDHWAVRSKGLSDAKVKQDMTKIKNFAKLNNLPIGIYFWGHASSPKVDHAKYYKDAIELAQKVKRWYGTPEHIQIQSWEQTVGNNGEKENVIPNNLPESWRFSHTSILNETLKILGL